jgi:hypothetical protein
MGLKVSFFDIFKTNLLFKEWCTEDIAKKLSEDTLVLAYKYDCDTLKRVIYDFLVKAHKPKMFLKLISTKK